MNYWSCDPVRWQQHFCMGWALQFSGLLCGGLTQSCAAHCRQALHSHVHLSVLKSHASLGSASLD